MTAWWGIAAAAALLWPDRIRGPFDGVPLDGMAEAVLIGVVFPALWWFHPAFLRTRLAQACIVALAAARIAAAIFFVQEGWCVRFDPARPYVWDQTGAPHAWDLRANWRQPDPACSAIMTRSYEEIDDFPAWFVNLPPPSDSWPGPADRPPGATIAITLQGFLHADRDGTLSLDLGPDVAATLRIDGALAAGSARVAAGTHTVNIDGRLTGTRWRLVPRWNDADLWTTTSIATVKRPSRLDVIARASLRRITTLITALVLFGWIASAAARVHSATALAWSLGASAAIAWLVSGDHIGAARWALVATAASALLPLPRRLHNVFGAFVLVGVPWLTLVATRAAPAVGHFLIYDVGHDYWMFQRFAYRIVMQGYWLEGGSPTFWFQPLYRWIAGLLHVLFGDSSVGEFYWDGACLLAGSLFAFRIARTFAGFRWGVVAAVLPLAVMVLGTPEYLIGRGLGEISSAGFLYLAAFFAMRSRHGRLRAAIAAGLLATLAFFTRLNNLPAAAAVALFAIAPSRKEKRQNVQGAAAIASTLAAGILFFAWRTWHYTGVFSVFHGTQRELLSLWQGNPSPGELISRISSSVAMVLSVNDPPRLDPYALPVLAGAAAAVGRLVRAPRLRSLPLAPVLFFFAMISSAFVARGSAYPGRFSVHIVPVTCALALCGVAALTHRRGSPCR